MKLYTFAMSKPSELIKEEKKEKKRYQNRLYLLHEVLEHDRQNGRTLKDWERMYINQERGRLLAGVKYTQHPKIEEKIERLYKEIKN